MTLQVRVLYAARVFIFDASKAFVLLDNFVRVDLADFNHAEVNHR